MKLCKFTDSDYQAVIEGHADEQGTREYNIALGGRRANAVREYMISRGVAASRLKTIKSAPRSVLLGYFRSLVHKVMESCRIISCAQLISKLPYQGVIFAKKFFVNVGIINPVDEKLAKLCIIC